MAKNKLTKEIVFNAFGKHKDSEEFKKILDILGEPTIEPDIDSNLIDYSWNHYGIDIVLSYDTELFYNIFFYPQGTHSDKDYLDDREPCKPICNDNDFEQNLTMQEIREKYGNPNTEKETYGGYVFRYPNIDGYKRFFTFSDENTLYSIMIGWRD